MHKMCGARAYPTNIYFTIQASATELIMSIALQLNKIGTAHSMFSTNYILNPAFMTGCVRELRVISLPSN